MTVYMVERNLKGIAMSDLAAAQRMAIIFQGVCRQRHADALYPVDIRA